MFRMFDDEPPTPARSPVFGDDASSALLSAYTSPGLLAERSHQIHMTSTRHPKPPASTGRDSRSGITSDTDEPKEV